MSRFPFGLCLGLVLTNQGCVGLASHVPPTAEIRGHRPDTLEPFETIATNSADLEASLYAVNPVFSSGTVPTRNVSAPSGTRYYAYPGGPLIDYGTPQPWSQSSLRAPVQPQQVSPEQTHRQEIPQTLQNPLTEPSPLTDAPLASDESVSTEVRWPEKSVESFHPLSPPTNPDPPVQQSPTATVTSVEAGDPNWFQKLRSTGGRPFEVMRTGQGPLRVLVIGSLYGNEPESVQLVDAYSKAIGSQSTSPQVEYLILRSPNPDGFVEHIKTNKNGVELNRNFPSTWFTASPNRLTGPHPGSEVETQHLLRILKEFRPHRVVHIRGSIGVRPLVLTNSHLKFLQPEIARLDQVDVGGFDGSYKAGSFEEFVSVRSGFELATVYLPPQGFPQLSTRQLQILCESNLKEKLSQQPEEVLPQQFPPAVSQPDRVPTASNAPEKAPVPDGQKGFVQLLPPPPQPERFNNASQSEVQGDPRYYELPPPASESSIP